MPSDELTPIMRMVPEELRDLARVQAREIRFMRRKLKQARDCIGDEEIVIPYDNGGGQAGIRANPAYAEYERLHKTYAAAIRTLLDLVPEKQASKGKANVSKLDKMASSLKLVAGK